MKWNRLLALCLGLCLLCSCAPKTPETTPTPAPSPTAAPTPTPEPTETPSPANDEAVRVSMLKGPTGLGACKLMADKSGSGTMEFTVFAEPTEAVAALTKGEVDVAALPTNLASTLYHKTDGGIQLLCLNTLGVLYILENGESVRSVADLKGKTVHAFGQGANPEYVLNYLLKANGLTPGQDVTVQWYSSADEVSALMASGEIEVCMLPVPAATAVLLKNEKVREAIDLTEAWEDAGAEGVLTMGCVVVRTEFAQSCPEAVDQFLTEYADSIAFMTDPANLDDVAALAEEYGIVPKAAIAKKAIPAANLCFMTGDDMMDGIQGYYQVLYAADPKSIGGSIPDGAFYYTPILSLADLVEQQGDKVKFEYSK